MIRRRNIIVSLALLALFAFAPVADAGLFCGCGSQCGRKCRTMVRYTATCETVSGGTCVGSGRTCPQAIANAVKNCGEEVLMCHCPRKMIYRKGLFGWRLIAVCEVPVCAAEKAALVTARCPTAGGACYGWGATCELAKANARANCTRPITGPCICPNTTRREPKGQ